MLVSVLKPTFLGCVSFVKDWPLLEIQSSFALLFIYSVLSVDDRSGDDSPTYEILPARIVAMVALSALSLILWSQFATLTVEHVNSLR
jgi:hypothetical protein